jgi:hypothetical protein
MKTVSNFRRTSSSLEDHKMNELFTFIPSQKYEEVEKLLASTQLEDIPEIDKAEALESMGIVEFYNGQWDRAAGHLQKSLDFTSVSRRRKPRRLAIINLLVSYLFLSLSIFLLTMVSFDSLEHAQYEAEIYLKESIYLDQHLK